MSYDRNQDRTEAQRYADQIREDRRDDASTLNGMTLGILVAVAIAAAATAFYLVSQRNETAPTPVIAPSSSTVAPEKETIIREEKTREIVPVPQVTSEPNVNIIVPPSISSPSTAPSASEDNSLGSNSAPSIAPSQSPSLVPDSNPSPAN